MNNNARQVLRKTFPIHQNLNFPSSLKVKEKFIRFTFQQIKHLNTIPQVSGRVLDTSTFLKWLFLSFLNVSTESKTVFTRNESFCFPLSNLVIHSHKISIFSFLLRKGNKSIAFKQIRRFEIYLCVCMLYNFASSKR